MATNAPEETGGKIWKRLRSIFHISTHSQAPTPNTETETVVQSDSNPPLTKETESKIQLIEVDKIAPTGDALYYPLKPKKFRKVGKGIIIVNESFENQDDELIQLRQGAEKDQENFEAIFNKLGIDYTNRNFFNLKTGDMWKELKKFAKIEVPDDSVMFVAIATQCEQIGQITGTDNVVISLEHIYNFFYKNIDLLNIPKVFLIDANKAVIQDELQADIHPPMAKVERFKSQHFPSATAISDTLIVQSILEDRDVANGSFFIQELRKSIHNPKYKNLHFVEIITLCTGSIMKDFPKFELYCSTSIQSTLRMKLRF